MVVVGVVCVLVVCVSVGVVAVVVLVVFGVGVVSVACGSGCAHSASARVRRFSMPWRSVLCRPASMLAGSAAKSWSVFSSALSVAAQSAVAVLGRLRDGFEVALQRTGVAGGYQALARARAGDEQRREHAQHGGERDAEHNCARDAGASRAGRSAIGRRGGAVHAH